MNDTKIGLAGEWVLRDGNGEYTIPATVPGDTHSALHAAGIIPDPYWGKNELSLQWIGQRDWTFSRSFFLESGIESCYLRAESLDTIAIVHINGTEVSRTDNMFVPILVDISAAAHTGENEISITFRSAEKEAAVRAQSLPYPVPHQIYPVQSMHRNLVRKTQCHSGWDWGPDFMVAGIYGEIAIDVIPGPAIVAAYGNPRPAGSGLSATGAPGGTSGLSATGAPGSDRDNSLTEWFVPVAIDFLNRADARIELVIEIIDPEGSTIAENRSTETIIAGEQTLSRVLSVSGPRLWWPNGYGDPVTYTVRVRAGAQTRSYQIGFRTVELVNRDDEIGRSMFFRVNGRDIWAKGANWIPTDALPALQTDERYRELLQSSHVANMNMIRVWGGGQYERDAFYDLCDRMGLLVWQDFMFSCSLYPSQEWFLDAVRVEATAQVKRLQSHPAVAIWCGNNENLGALGWFDISRKNPGRYLIDFDRLYNGVIGKVVGELDPGRPFWPSIPAAGEGDFSDNWHDDSSGDMHYWSVWHEGKPFEGYYEVVPRFCSEFGFQSFPSLHTIRTFAPAEHENPTAPLLEHHQRHPRGNTIVTETIARYFRVPFTFGDFLYLSQVQQAMAIRMAVEYWRSRRPVSMGALYWQLNDVWPVVSWSSLEYDGRWKLLHYEARRFFAPVHVTLLVKDGTLHGTVLNDRDETLRGDVRLRFLDWRGNTVSVHRNAVSVEPDSAVEAYALPVDQIGHDSHDVFAVIDWEPVTDGASERVSGEPLRNWCFLTEPKRCELLDPDVTVSITDSVVTVAVSNAPAFWTTLESTNPDHRFSDAGFLLLPGESKSISVSGTSDSIREADLVVRHLKLTY